MQKLLSIFSHSLCARYSPADVVYLAAVSRKAVSDLHCSCCFFLSLLCTRIASKTALSSLDTIAPILAWASSSAILSNMLLEHVTRRIRKESHGLYFSGTMSRGLQGRLWGLKYSTGDGGARPALLVENSRWQQGIWSLCAKLSAKGYAPTSPQRFTCRQGSAARGLFLDWDSDIWSYVAFMPLLLCARRLFEVMGYSSAASVLYQCMKLDVHKDSSCLSLDSVIRQESHSGSCRAVCWNICKRRERLQQEACQGQQARMLMCYSSEWAAQTTLAAETSRWPGNPLWLMQKLPSWKTKCLNLSCRLVSSGLWAKMSLQPLSYRAALQKSSTR